MTFTMRTTYTYCDIFFKLNAKVKVQNYNQLYFRLAELITIMLSKLLDCIFMLIIFT